ncbi:MAG: stage II sporulation protein M [Nitrosopumilaceae archaeon]|nr:stage II sporulation protein M [Nitrosopumilaceae archaeon]NIU00890.1 stage II sporulation protein M [Nitrosopumilaceae archaeon]NIU87343.1 stage II sporulation protein M [Nitrosopumilaceae archaeon]NIV65871.1 stage II sporulation protein M [Nitrosopumilaceae archaeon]NIX61492.1 stage II sporulation protein M [Nitrosopumilaceae archaeon]
MGVFSGAFQIGAISEVNDKEAEQFLKEFEELVKDIDAVGIFTHNTSIALPMFIPGFGVAWGLFAAWSTGFAFASLSTLNPLIAEVPPLAILYLSPFGIMELVAYSIGISRSFILIQMIVKKLDLKPVIKITVIEIGIVVALLLMGGFIEFSMIEMVQQGEIGLPEEI